MTDSASRVVSSSMEHEDASLPRDDLRSQRAWLRRLALHLAATASVADDLEQDTWLAAARRSDDAPPSRGWLATVLRNRLRDLWKTDRRRREREECAARPEGQDAADDVVARAEIQRHVVAAVHALPEPQRSTVLLRYFDDLPPREIAERLGVPVETVRSRLRRAHELLRRDLDRTHGDDRRAWLLPLLASLDPPTTPMMRIPRDALVAAALVLAVAGGLTARALTTPPTVDPPTATAEPSPVITQSETVELPTTASIAIVDIPPTTEPEPVVTPAARVEADTPPAPPPAEVVGGTLTGRVRIRGAGAPGAGAFVEIERDEPSAARVACDQDGAFRVSDLVADSQLHLRPGRAGLAGVPQPFDTPDAGETRDIGVLWLDPAAALEVRVVDALGTPLSGARVTVEEDPAGNPAPDDVGWYWGGYTGWRNRRVALGRTTAGSDGVARLDPLPAGDWLVRATVSGHMQEMLASVAGRVGETATTTVRMLPGAPLTGRLVRVSGEPVAGATLALRRCRWNSLWRWDRPPPSDVHARTDADGRFRVDALSADDYSVSLVSDPAGIPLGGVRVPHRGDVRLVLRSATLIGTVRDALTGEPVPGATVSASSYLHAAGPNQALTDHDGAYSLSIVATHPLVAIAVRAPGYAPFEESGSGSYRLLEMPRHGATLRRDYALLAEAQLSGTVSDTNGPAPGARVVVVSWTPSPWSDRGYLRPRFASVIADERGAYTIGGLPAGPTTVRAVPPGALARSLYRRWRPTHSPNNVPADVQLIAGQENRLDVRTQTVSVPASHDRPPPGWLSGTVRTAGGAAIGGGYVQILRAPNNPRDDRDPSIWTSALRVPTAPDGSYRLGIPYHRGRVFVRAVAPGHAPSLDVLERRAPDEWTDQQRDLHLGVAHTLRGRVRSLAADAPLADARIYLRDTAQSHWNFAWHATNGGYPVTAVTDGRGAFQVPSVRAGIYEVRVIAEGHATVQQTWEVPGDGSIQFELPPGLGIGGHAYYGDGRPVTNARVEAVHVHGGPTKPRPGTLIGSDGSFRIERLRAGEYRLRFWSNEHPRAFQERSVRVQAGTYAVNVDVDAGLQLRGRVLDEAGSPVVGAQVRLDRIDQRKLLYRATETGPDGSFAFGGLPARAYRLEVFPASDEFLTFRPPVVRAGTALLPEEVERLLVTNGPVDVVLRRGGSVSGTLTFSDGTPAVSRWVAAQHVGGLRTGPAGHEHPGARTDASGDFRIDGLDTGRYRLVEVLRSIDLRTVGGPSSVRAGDTGVAIISRHTAMIRGTIRDDRGYPVSGAIVSATPETGRSLTARSDRNGRFRVTDVIPGTLYRVEATKAERVPDRMENVLADGDDLLLRVTRGLRSSGELLATDGRPAPDATLIFVHVESGRQVGSGLDPKARFDVRGMDPGTWRAEVMHFGDGSTKRVPCGEFEAGERGLRLVLPPR